jgi:succinate dehydrogenase/fumarate reductase-like Fe-S protein
MEVFIHRYNPDTGDKWIDSFEVPTEEKSMTVMDVLEYISANLDNTLGYYKHSVCNHGICGRCSLSINGRTRLACIELANNYDTLTLGPVPSRKLIRDLVTRL